MYYRIKHAWLGYVSQGSEYTYTVEEARVFEIHDAMEFIENKSQFAQPHYRLHPVKE